MFEIPGYYSQNAVDAQHEQMMKEFDILGEEIENLKAENKRLKQERDKLKEILDKHVLMKMYPAKCTDKIQVFESREEYNEVMKFISCDINDKYVEIGKKRINDLIHKLNC